MGSTIDDQSRITDLHAGDFELAMWTAYGPFRRYYIVSMGDMVFDLGERNLHPLYPPLSFGGLFIFPLSR